MEARPSKDKTNSAPNIQQPQYRFEYLKVPERERNYLLSPPAFPPVGWVQTSEREPSKGGILRQTSMSSLLEFELDGGVAVEIENEHDRDDVKCYKSNDSLVYEFGNELPTVVVNNTSDYVPSSKVIPKTELPK